MTENKRFKLAIFLCCSAMIIGLLKTLLPAYPTTEVYAIMGGISAYYFTVQTITDRAKITTNNAKDPNS